MEEYCDDCHRWFGNIQAHYANSSNHIYCKRCNRNFVSLDARQAHWENSRAHNLCDFCSFDGEDHDELKQHHDESDCCGYECEGCHAWFRTLTLIKEHWADVVACEECSNHCHTEANRKHHMATQHSEASIECWGCYNKFVRVSDMISHLESGSCASGCNSEVINYKLMVKCSNLRQFVKPKYRQAFRQSAAVGKVYTEYFPFACEGCGISYGLLSSLCQHLESIRTTACERRISDVSLHPMKREFEQKVLK